ncbi:hypothetical protein [Streptosporangium sp. NPDC023615]|uniref:hypothetical protein n=1 Tax=Streptosporangium sp. NPDC023615 TaxID=3154794 RepID=UPI0034233C26
MPRTTVCGVIRTPHDTTQTYIPEQAPPGRPSARTVTGSRTGADAGTGAEAAAVAAPTAAPVDAPGSFGNGRGRGPALFMVVPATLLTLLVITVISVTTPELDVALGRAGTPGVAAVRSCTHADEQGFPKRGHHECRARFVFDDPSREPIVVGTIPDVEVGEVFPAALPPGGDRVLPTGERGMWRAVLLYDTIPFALSLVAFLSALATGSRRMTVWAGVLAAPFCVLLVLGKILGT